MKSYACFFVAVLAMAVPSEGLLGAKIALLGALRNGFAGGGYGNGAGAGTGYSGGYGGSYGNGGYGNGAYGNGGYGNGGYGNGGYGAGLSYNRPVYTGQSSNYGWGQQSYGGGYSGYGGNAENVKIVKVIVSHDQPQGYYENYGTNSAAASSTLSSSTGASWTPISAPAPVLQTYAAQHVSLPASAPISVPIQVQSPSIPNINYPAPAALPAPVQVIQPPSPSYQQVTVQRPIQYQVPPPQAILRQNQPFYQQLQPQPQLQHTIRLIVDDDSQRTPAQTYGPAAPASTNVAAAVDNSAAWNSDSWSNSRPGTGLNSVGTGPWKTGGIWESVGC